MRLIHVPDRQTSGRTGIGGNLNFLAHATVDGLVVSRHPKPANLTPPRRSRDNRVMHAGRMFLLALVLLPRTLWADPAPPPTPIDVSGTLPTGTTMWSGIMHVTANVTVPVGGVLQVEPGTEIRFEGGRQL